MTLSAAGVASLLQANAVLFGIVKYAGAGYLTWLAIGMLRAAWQMWRTRRAPAVGERVVQRGARVARGESVGEQSDQGGRRQGDRPEHTHPHVGKRTRVG